MSTVDIKLLVLDHFRSFLPSSPSNRKQTIPKMSTNVHDDLSEGTNWGGFSGLRGFSVASQKDCRTLEGTQAAGLSLFES